MLRFVLPLFIIAVCFDTIHSHGRLMDPVNRSSRWRVFSDATPNYIDDQINCGGKTNQWDVYGGKCGVCGDSYGDPHPQANENGGKYGQGVVVKEYTSGSTIDVNVVLTINHLGHFEFSLCKLTDPNSYEPGEDCFVPLTLGDGSETYVLPNKYVQGVMEVNLTVALPQDLTCERCVFRWHWKVANTWGTCDDGTEAAGCGAQQTFRSCSDISIV